MADKGDRGDGGRQKGQRRARFFQRMMKVGVFRRMYARRIMRYLEKSRTKGRPLPDEMVQLDDFLSRLPEKDRRAALEATLSGELESQAGRALKRAAARQGRQSGRGGGRQRPGAPPVPRPRPKTR